VTLTIHTDPLYRRGSVAILSQLI